MTKLCNVQDGATLTYDPGDGSTATLYVPEGSLFTYENTTFDDQTADWPVVADPGTAVDPPVADQGEEP